MFAFFFPGVFGFFEFFLQAFLTVPERSSFFEALALHHFIFLLFNVFYFLFQVKNFLWNVDVLQVNPCTYFVHHIDGFIWQQPVRNVTVRQFHTSVNGFISVADVVIVFVLRLDVVQDLHGFIYRRWIYDHFLEPAV